MDWQQKIFQKAWHWLRDFKPGPRNVLAGEAVSLTEIHGRLTLFARLLTGESIELLRAEQEGGWAGHFFYLPATFRLGETQEAATPIMGDSVLTLDELTRRYILRVLERNHGAKDKTARMLGIDRKTLYRKLTEYDASMLREEAVSGLM